MWVSLLIPKIEDGNNFGVSVQEDTLAEIQQVEVEATNYLEQVSRYYASRGKLITKVSVIVRDIKYGGLPLSPLGPYPVCS